MPEDISRSHADETMYTDQQPMEGALRHDEHDHSFEPAHLHSTDCGHLHAESHIDVPHGHDTLGIKSEHSGERHVHGDGCGHEAHGDVHGVIDAHSNKHEHEHGPGCSHIHHEKAHDHVDSGHIHSGSCGHLRHTEVSLAIDTHSHEHRHGPGCGHVAHEQAKDYVNQPASDVDKAAQLSEIVTATQAETVVGSGYEAVFHAQEAKQNVQTASDNVAVGVPDKIMQAVKPSEDQAVPFRKPLTQDKTPPTSSKMNTSSAVTAPNHHVAERTVSPDDATADRLVLEGTIVDDVTPAKPLETEYRGSPHSPNLDNHQITSEYSPALVRLLNAEPTAEMTETFIEVVGDNVPLHDEYLYDAGFVESGQSDEVIAVEPTVERPIAETVPDVANVRDGADTATRPVETAIEKVFDADSELALKTDELISVRLVVESLDTYIKSGTQEISQIHIDEILAAGVYLAPHERVELLRAVEVRDMSHIKGIFERLIEQTKAGLFQEDGAIWSTQQPDEDENANSSLLGRLVLRVLQRNYLRQHPIAT